LGRYRLDRIVLSLFIKVARTWSGSSPMTSIPRR